MFALFALMFALMLALVFTFMLQAFTYLAVFSSIQGKLMLSTMAVKHVSELKITANRFQVWAQAISPINWRKTRLLRAYYALITRLRTCSCVDRVLVLNVF